MKMTKTFEMCSVYSQTNHGKGDNILETGYRDAVQSVYKELEEWPEGLIHVEFIICP